MKLNAKLERLNAKLERLFPPSLFFFLPKRGRGSSQYFFDYFKYRNLSSSEGNLNFRFVRFVSRP